MWLDHGFPVTQLPFDPKKYELAMEEGIDSPNNKSWPKNDPKKCYPKESIYFITPTKMVSNTYTKIHPIKRHPWRCGVETTCFCTQNIATSMWSWSCPPSSWWDIKAVIGGRTWEKTKETITESMNCNKWPERFLFSSFFPTWVEGSTSYSHRFKMGQSCEPTWLTVWFWWVESSKTSTPRDIVV